MLFIAILKNKDIFEDCYHNELSGRTAMPEYGERIHFIVNVLFAGVILAVLYAAVRLALPVTLPFFIGLGIAFVLKPVTTFLAAHTPFRRRAASLVVISLFYALIFSILFGVCAAAFSQFGRLLTLLPNLYAEGVEPILSAVNRFLARVFSLLSPSGSGQVGQFFDMTLEALRNGVQEVSASAVEWLAEAIRGLPMLLTTLVFTVISSIMISADYAAVTSFLLRQLPPRYRHMLLDAKDFMVGSLFCMFKAYLLILLITMAELAVGLCLLGVDLFLAAAVLIALLDILPLIGTGGILIPWGLLELARGNYPLGAGLIVLTVVITLVRNLIEPKIVGKQIGLHPVVTLSAMYLGLRLFGFIGLLLAPMSALLVKYLNDSGRIHLYK